MFIALRHWFQQVQIVHRSWGPLLLILIAGSAFISGCAAKESTDQCCQAESEPATAANLGTSKSNHVESTMSEQDTSDKSTQPQIEANTTDASGTPLTRAQGESATKWTASSSDKETAPSQSKLAQADATAHNKLERVANVTVNQHNVLATVVSNGCTSAQDFTVQYELVNDQCRVSIVRTKPDYCKRAPMAVDLRIASSLPSDCVGAEMIVINPELKIEQNNLILKRLK